MWLIFCKGARVEECKKVVSCAEMGKMERSEGRKLLCANGLKG